MGYCRHKVLCLLGDLREGEGLLMKLEAKLKVQYEGFRGIYWQKLNIIFMLCFHACVII